MPDIDLRAAAESIFGPIDWDNLPRPTSRDLEREAHAADGGRLRPDSPGAPFIAPRAGRTPTQAAQMGYVHHGNGTYTWEAS